MSARQSLSIHLAERPKGEIVPGTTFRQTLSPASTAADLKDGDVLVETLYLSLDPAMRGWLNDARSYVPPVAIGEVMRGAVVARVVASRSDRARPGDLVTTSAAGWREVAAVPGAQVEVLALPAGGRPTDALGVLGMTGLTAFFGMERIGKPQPGETVVVSGAAGATGSVAGQLAKIAGARVVGTAGSDEKVAWLKELGFDVALNYKDPDFKQKFKEATPDYIDVYWDNVGGEQLDMALGRAHKFARFVMCGGISQYNATKGPEALKSFNNIIAQRIKLQGFIVFDYASEYSSARKQLAEWLSQGKLQRKETIIKGGLKAAERALVDLYHGANMGKLLVEVMDPEQAPDNSSRL